MEDMLIIGRHAEFCKYVKERSNNKIIVERDHGGPGQGKSDDDGISSHLKKIVNIWILYTLIRGKNIHPIVKG